MNKTNQRGDRKLIRSMNAKLVLDTIRASESISQAELARKTKLSMGTIVRIVHDLRATGLVESIGLGAAAIGRKPTRLRLNPTYRYVMAVDLAPDEIILAVLDLDAHIVAQHRFGLEAGILPEQFIAIVKEQCLSLLKREKIAKRKIAGMGLTVHGAMDLHTGTIIHSKHMNWHHFPLCQMITQSLGIPAWANTQARAMTLAEQRWGAGVGASDLLMVVVDAGIGMAAIAGGQLCLGGHGMAGEFGQNILLNQTSNQEGRVCLEDVASGMMMVEQAKKIASSGKTSLDFETLNSASLRLALRALFDAAADGDRQARRIVENASRYLGLAIANMINVFDPQRVLLAGYAITESRGILTSKIRQIAIEHVWNIEDRQMLVEPAILGALAPIMGASALAYDHLFSVEGSILAQSVVVPRQKKR